MRYALLALFLAACPDTNGGKDDTSVDDTDDPDTGNPDDTAVDDTAETGDPPDADGDGWPDAEDCDDGNPAIYPGADEHCDGIDEDCDGTADNDPVEGLWYRDADADTFGTDTDRTYSCTQPEGYVAQGGDCNDDNDSVHPAANEHCDGADEDCNGRVDDDALDGVLYYLDGDADGHGDASVTEHFCTEPTTHVLADDDCDDADGTTYPGADEVCEDGADNGCDGVDDCAPAGAYLPPDAGVTLLGTAEKAFVGSGLYAGDLDGDGQADLTVGAYGHNPGGQNLTGQAYVFYGPLDGSETLASASATVLGSAADDALGWSLAGGDFDADGIPDLVVGAFGAEIEGNEDGGAAYVFAGGLAGAYSADDAWSTVAGERADDYAGWSVASAGGDLLVSAPLSDQTGSDAGAVGVFSTGAGMVDFYTGANALFTGSADGDQAGYAVASGDVDGDGTADIVVGAPYASTGGLVYVVFGASMASMSLDGSDVVVTATGTDDRLGISLATGDTDGDGRDDVIAGADYNDDGATDAGIAYVLPGLALGVVSAGTADATFTGAAASDYAGRSVGLAGDVNADGTVDLLVGATAFDSSGGAGVGAAYLAYGPLLGARTLGSPDASYQGGNASDAAGHRVAGADLDGDGYDDVLTSAMGRDDGGTNAGGVYGWWGTAQ